MTEPVCSLMRPGQPCARWETPPLGVCSREAPADYAGRIRICGECIRDVDGPLLGFRRAMASEGEEK